MLGDHLLLVEDLHCAGELHTPWLGNTFDPVLRGLGDTHLKQETAKLRKNSRWRLTIGAELRSCLNGLWLWFWVILVSQQGVVWWVVAVTLAVDSILLWLRLSKLLLLWLNRLLLLGLNRQMWFNRLLLLARGSTGCQQPDGKMTYSALVSDMMDVNHLHFRDRRV
jgi:hypothetical protein